MDNSAQADACAMVFILLALPVYHYQIFLGDTSGMNPIYTHIVQHRIINKRT